MKILGKQITFSEIIKNHNRRSSASNDIDFWYWKISMGEKHSSKIETSIWPKNKETNL